MAMSSKTSGAASGAMSGAATGSVFGVPGIVIGAVAGGLLGALGSGGEKEAKRLGRANALLIRETTEENLRRMRLSMGQQLSGAKARTYASNLMMGGTQRSYINVMREQWKSDMSWEQMKGDLEADIARRGGQIAARTIQNASLANMARSAGQLAGALS